MTNETDRKNPYPQFTYSWHGVLALTAEVIENPDRKAFEHFVDDELKTIREQAMTVWEAAHS